jgi:phenylacetate-CoA ligase
MDTRMSAPADADRYPTLSDAGRALLRSLSEHPAAPIFRNQSGNRLLPEDLVALADFERDVLHAPIRFSESCGSDAAPDWLKEFLDAVYRDVPHYRALRAPPLNLRDAPVVSRADFARDIAAFVPDSAPLARLINFRTTGTTGHPLLIASQPRVAASYLALHKRALARRGIRLTHGAGQVGVILLGFQKTCFTYVSVTPQMDESALIKLNLHTDDWRDAGDRARYIEAMAPEVIAGDPLSFAEYITLGIRHRPRAALCVAMALSDGFRRTLEAALECPVLDLYSMNEAGPIGVYEPSAAGHVLLQPRMIVEVLDAQGDPVPPGARGELTLTGGFNDCLPLLRYRTGDFGRLADMPAGPAILDLEGRRPVRFRTQRGEWINNIDVSHALKHLPIAQYSVHQTMDGALICTVPPNAANLHTEILEALSPLFGAVTLQTRHPSSDGKPLQYTSDLRDALI